MKSLLAVVSLMFVISSSAFAAQKRIECMSKNKLVHVGLVGSNSDFDTVETLTIIKGGLFGKDLQVQNPNCRIDLRESVHGPFVVINCEEQKLLVNQFLTQGIEGHGTLIGGLRSVSLA